MAVKIKTDGKWRNLIYGYEIPQMHGEFDYMAFTDFESHDFAKYRGRYYDPSEFIVTRNTPELSKWDGYSADTYFSGIVIKFSKDGEKYKIGRYHVTD